MLNYVKNKQIIIIFKR